MLLTILRSIAFLIIGGGFGDATYSIIKVDTLTGEGRRPSFRRPILLVCAGLLLFVTLSGAAQIPATHIGVAENTWTGQFATLPPGTHVWPFQPKLVPFVTQVWKYDLRRQTIEIGSQPVSEQGVQADSNSPGRPVVYFYARGWAWPNPDAIVELHRKYGPGYLDNWVERVWISSLKAVQGESPYDYVGNYRVKMQDEVETNLQKQLLGEAEQPIVFVSQLAIVDFDFDASINAYLDAVAQKSFEMQQAEQQILINEKQQKAATIDAETRYITTKRAAEAEQAKLIAEAEGRSRAEVLLADAEAYKITVKYKAEAEGVQLVQKALAQSPAAYLDYVRIQSWDGRLPNYWLGQGALPLLNLKGD